MVFDHPNLADSPDLASQLDEGAGLCWETAVNVVNKVDPMKHWIMSLSVCVLGYQIQVCFLFFPLRLNYYHRHTTRYCNY
jgi:hypothetical protein